MRIFALFAWLSLSCLNVQTASERPEATEGIIRKATFVVAAFACVATEKGPKAESERLFNAALKAGHEVIQFMTIAHPEERKVIRAKIPMVWADASGPTPDFILGRLFESVTENQWESKVTRQYSDPDWTNTKREVWEARLESLWRDNNCQLLAPPEK